MLSKKAKKQLVQLASDLDKKGFTKEADMIDEIISEPSGSDLLIEDALMA